MSTATTTSIQTVLSEDDIYRSSSQYRLWSFPPERLAALRRKTHELAIERISAQQKVKSLAQSNGSEPDYLTEEEELRLVQRYCEQIRFTSDHLQWPVSVKATAIQYLRRFYLSNSVITYPPREIYKTALFLACKTEATHVTLTEYARRISSNADEILAPEYKLMQALRFTLDVRHPFRGLKGVLLELLNMVEGLPQQEYRNDLLALSGPGNGCTTVWKAPSGSSMDSRHLQDRIQAAYAAAKSILDFHALMTDVYFLYTPAQILHAAIHRADAGLSEFYLSIKLSDNISRARVMTAIQGCADMLAAFTKEAITSKEERAALEVKLEKCRDTSTRNLVETHHAKKSGDVMTDEERAKRRQAERERGEKEGHDLFGPPLKHGIS